MSSGIPPLKLPVVDRIVLARLLDADHAATVGLKVPEGPLEPVPVKPARWFENNRTKARLRFH